VSNGRAPGSGGARLRGGVAAVLAATVTLLAAGCDREGPGGPSAAGRVAVESDPPGARILLDGRNTGRRTPDTISGLTRRHDVAARIDTLGIAYGFLAQVVAHPDTIRSVFGPLVMRCGAEACWENTHRYHSPFGVRFASNPVGALFLRDGRGGSGLFWPAGTTNGYVSGGMPVFAAVADARDTVALGIYDQRYLAGRPTPETRSNGSSFELLQSTWILPPVDALTFRTARGIEIEQHLVTGSGLEDVIIVRLVFRNISATRAYQAVDPIVPAGGVSYESAFIGFALDPDIGTPTTDWISYAPDLSMVFAYSSAFRETAFSGVGRGAPALVGLQLLDSPPGVRVVLNGWAHGGGSGTSDWRAGSASERTGWGMLSGVQPFAPSHPDPRVGHLPATPGDMRLSVSAGPVRLRPGERAEIMVALLLASPVQGAYTSGTLMPPGDPAQPQRPLAEAAAGLFELARAAAAAFAN
jgi:hypothetical protein